MAKGIVRAVQAARRNAALEIGMARGDGTSLYARGLASEGYAGGYRDALEDVLLALNGVTPNRRFWRRDDKKEKGDE